MPLTLVCLPCLSHNYSPWRVIKSPSHRATDARGAEYLRLFRKCLICGHVSITSKTKGPA